VLATCKEIRAARPAAGIILFSYLNPVIRMGMAAFAKAAKDAGADGVLLTDMIVEEADEYLRVMRENNLSPVFLAAPTSPDERLKAIAENSRGFVYAISRVGITGTQTELACDAQSLVDRIRQFTKLPIALGFGISNAEHVRAVNAFADAAVVGSAVVQLIESTPAAEAPKAVGEFVASLLRHSPAG
jgi:tryptophan synthase alpha chain